MEKILLVIFLLPFFTQGQEPTIESYQPKYVVADSWVDGTLMDNSKVDGFIYIKRNRTYYRLNYQGNLDGRYFGMTPDDKTDDSKALQAAINYALRTSKNLVISSGKYYIDNTILIPQHFSYSMKSVKIDFSNSRLVLRKDITMFESDNWGTKIDSKITNGLVLGDFEIVNEAKTFESYAIKIQDFHQGAKLENISASNIKNLLHSKNNYYLELYNVNSNAQGGKRFLFDGYHGLNKFTKLTAVNSDISYSFEGGMVAALDMQNISVEGCRIGINFDSEVYNFNLKNSYLENFSTALVFKNYVHSASIDNNYINFLGKGNTYLLEYKGLPINNIHFNKGNTYLGTDFSNLVKNKEDIYGVGIVFEVEGLDSKRLNTLKQKVGKNISIK
ncbi:hypothetical protein ACR78I_12565 [Sphingobacterium multivorum]|uniref:hypothetical protein n=1 Tax=Sphingobacterium multivorum TaxID=28454 RepID=UPI003DA4A84B